LTISPCRSSSALQSWNWREPAARSVRLATALGGVVVVCVCVWVGGGVGGGGLTSAEHQLQVWLWVRIQHKVSGV
jgi:hypothetical protein